MIGKLRDIQIRQLRQPYSAALAVAVEASGLRIDDWVGCFKVAQGLRDAPGGAAVDRRLSADVLDAMLTSAMISDLIVRLDGGLPETLADAAHRRLRAADSELTEDVRAEHESFPKMRNMLATALEVVAGWGVN